ncbi:MAG: Sugar phosphate permease [Intestinibacter bartlettii DORA_8_9]|uniref:Inner membrane protein YqcE n=2 Tax=root TaxID=1 RepID=A0A6N3FI29_9FIRM|nr:MAG: Sugar phosphate permease [Intestinibacter bartlettii DORA_8_9]
MKKIDKKWITLIVLFVGSGIMYQLPLLRVLFYEQMVEGMNLTSSQIGVFGAAYGVATLIFYFPGGIIADKISCRKLITLSFVMMSIGGFYYATLPAYKISIAINFYFGTFATLTYWAALIKATSLVGENEESSKMFGLSEGGRGVTSTIAGFIAMQLFNILGGAKFGLSAIITFYSVVYLICAILSWKYLQEPKQASNLEKTSVTLKDLKIVLKDKNIWLIAIMIMSFFSIFVSQAYITPYLTEIFGISTGVAIFLNIVRSYVTQFTGAPLGGIIAQKMGSASKFIRIGFIICIISIGIFLILPYEKNFMIIAVINMIILMFVNYAVRGVYFSTINEANIKPELRGSASGFASLIGFTPDVFAPVLIGFFIDNFGSRGYKYMFGYIFISLIIGLIAVNLLISNIYGKNIIKKQDY